MPEEHNWWEDLDNGDICYKRSYDKVQGKWAHHIVMHMRPQEVFLMSSHKELPKSHRDQIEGKLLAIRDEVVKRLQLGVAKERLVD